MEQQSLSSIQKLSQEQISKTETPTYFKPVTGFDIIPVGPKQSSLKVANEPGYDLYILAGIDDNELFSKLITMNLSIPQGIAFDENTSKISQYFPENIKVIGKKVSFKNDNFNENLSGINGHENIFMKMNTYGDEYLWILSASTDTLNKFKQMIIIFHDINNNPTQQRALNKIKCFKKLTETHDVVHIEPDESNLIVTYFRKNSKTSEISMTGSVSTLPSYTEELEDELSFEESDDEVIEEWNIDDSKKKQEEVFKLSKRIKQTTQKVAKNMVKKMFKMMIHEASDELTKEMETILENLNSKKSLDNISAENEVELTIEEEDNEETKAESKKEVIETTTESIEEEAIEFAKKETKKKSKKVVDLKDDSSNVEQELATANIQSKEIDTSKSENKDVPPTERTLSLE